MKHITILLLSLVSLASCSKDKVREGTPTRPDNVAPRPLTADELHRYTASMKFSLDGEGNENWRAYAKFTHDTEGQLDDSGRAFVDMRFLPVGLTDLFCFSESIGSDGYMYNYETGEVRYSSLRTSSSFQSEGKLELHTYHAFDELSNSWITSTRIEGRGTWILNQQCNQEAPATGTWEVYFFGDNDLEPMDLDKDRVHIYEVLIVGDEVFEVETEVSF